MGYTFKIGNAVPVFSKEDGYLYAEWEVESVKRDDAPTFPNDDLTENTNSRSPSYTVWSEFCKEVGIYDLFYDERGHLLAGHPGCVILTEEDLIRVRAARIKWERTSTKPPGFGQDPVFDEKQKKWTYPEGDKYDPYLARLIWLEWWMNWALKNCETPAIQNR